MVKLKQKKECLIFYTSARLVKTTLKFETKIVCAHDVHFASRHLGYNKIRTIDNGAFHNLTSLATL